jgi:2,3-dihydro-2,3-dihydroxybenzoate dehydrogenase
MIGARNRVGYSASKGAVTLLTKSMAMDHAHEKIRVNCICPGIVETEMVADVIEHAPNPDEARRVREALHPMGRFGQPEDIAGMAVFLATDEAKWITGAAMPVDGGYTAGKA